MLGAFSISVGIAVAQPAANGADREPEEPATPADAGDPPPSDEAGPQGAPLEPSVVLARSQQQLGTMEAAAKTIEDSLNEAREAKDVVKVLCLDDKFNQVTIALRSAAARLGGIESATNSGNRERLQHDSAVLGALQDRVSELKVEADQCIGEDGVAVDGSELSVSFDPSIPGSEVALPPPQPMTSAPPVAASPII